MVDQTFRGMPVPENVYRKRRITFFVAVLIIVIVIIGLVVVFTREKEVEVPDLTGFAINKAAFVTSVDDNFVYSERESNVYNVGEPVKMYIDVVGYPTYKEGRKFLVSSRLEIIVTGPDGLILQDHSGTVVEINDLIDDKSLLKYSINMDTQGLEPGEYTVELYAYDQITNTDTQTVRKFTIR